MTWRPAAKVATSRAERISPEPSYLGAGVGAILTHYMTQPLVELYGVVLKVS